jgi:hypothetical protein
MPGVHVESRTRPSGGIRSPRPRAAILRWTWRANDGEDPLVSDIDIRAAVLTGPLT